MSLIKDRFRGYLPIIVDIETSGLDPQKHALLEIAIQFIQISNDGIFQPGEIFFEHILPFTGAELDPKSLAFNQIDPFQPLRFALQEKAALKKLFLPIQQQLKNEGCQRAVLVGHNAWFDLLFLNEAIKRNKLRSPFHAFTCFDTATLSAAMYGQTVLAKAAEVAGITFDSKQAHSAVYDTSITTTLFCKILNNIQPIL